MVQQMALSELNAIMGWRNSFELKYDKKFFQKKQRDTTFKNEILQKMMRHTS